MSESFFTQDPENPDRTIYKLPSSKMNQYACKFCGIRIETTYLVTLPMKCDRHKVSLYLVTEENPA